MDQTMQERTAKVLGDDNKNPRKDHESLSDRDKAMSDVSYAQNLLRDAFPRNRYGKVEAALYEAYRTLKPLVESRIEREFTMRRVRSIHEGKARRIDGAELDALKQAQINEARRERKELQQRLARLDAALALADEEFHVPQMAAFREQPHQFGGTAVD